MSVIVLNLDDPPTATLKELPPPVDWEARQASLERLEKSDIVIQEFIMIRFFPSSLLVDANVLISSAFSRSESRNATGTFISTQAVH